VLETRLRQGSPLDKKIDEWKSQLLDLTRRNKLISFKPTKTKSLPFEETDPIAIASQLANGEDLYIRKQPDKDETDEDSTQNQDEGPEIEPKELLSSRTPDESDNSLPQY